MRFVKSLELPAVMASIYLSTVTEKQHHMSLSVHEIFVLNTYANREGSGEPALQCWLTTAFSARTHKVGT